MTNKKAVKISEEIKTEIKGIIQGAYDTIEIVQPTTKREQTFKEIVDALKAGKYFVMREGYTRNSIYVLLRNLKEKASLNVTFGETQTNGVKQYALFVQKEKAS